MIGDNPHRSALLSATPADHATDAYPHLWTNHYPHHVDQQKATPMTSPENSTDNRLWHGGIAGLKPLDLILPPSTTGNARQAAGREALAVEAPGMLTHVTPDDTSPDWVYFTPHRNYALAYAGASSFDYGAGALYVVQPVEPVEPDPDMPVTALRARAAIILTVYDPHVRMTRRRVTWLHAQIVAAERGGTARDQFNGMQRLATRGTGKAIMVSPSDGDLRQ